MTRPRVVVAVDVGGTKIAAAAVDHEGRCGLVLTRPTPSRQGPSAVLAAITEAVREVSGNDAEVAVAAVTIGTAGVIDEATGAVISASDTITGWAGTRIAEELSATLSLPVVVDNDARAHAVGEAWLGAGRGAGSVLMLAIGTGIGGAVVLDGRPLRGAHHVAGEVGHIPARGAEHLTCSCGRRGHLEAMSSGPGLLRHYLFLGGDAAMPDTRHLLDLARAGDALALRAVRESAVVLGATLAGLVMLVDPDVVVLGGGLVDAGDVWWEPMETALRAELIEVVADVPVRPAELGGSAALVGAARLAWTKLDQAGPVVTERT